MTKKRPLGLPSAKLVMIAALAGLSAGAVAVYVKRMGSGNTDAPVEAASQTCPAAKAKVEALKPLIKGEVAALVPADAPRSIALSFKDRDGKEMSLADFKGKTVLLNLWATWCVPCRKEMPALDALQKEKGGAAFDVVAVNIDAGTDEKPLKFYEETALSNLAFYRDASMGVFNTAKKEGLALGLPATMLFDAEGCLIASMNGPAEWAGADAKALIEGAMAQK